MKLKRKESKLNLIGVVADLCPGKSLNGTYNLTTLEYLNDFIRIISNRGLMVKIYEKNKRRVNSNRHAAKHSQSVG